MKSRTKPFVSIIMNCYNGEKYLNCSLKSIFNQTFKNWELIFWDNKSDDASQEIFNSFKDDRLKYFLSSGRETVFDCKLF